MPFTDPRFVLIPCLHVWEQSTWPEDDFTVEDNRGDLADLEAWNADRKALISTVLDPSETLCLGRVWRGRSPLGPEIRDGCAQ